jgi:tRNA pseudouridine13 synthase
VDATDALEEIDGVTVLERSRHKNKLGMGHLRGNHFRIRIRGVGAGDEAAARAVLTRLMQVGTPNFFGPQRFGRFGRNAVDGRRLLRGEHVPGDHRLKRFFLSALQSMLFNHLLALRMERGVYRSVLPGDWAKKHDTGGEFLVEDPAEAERAERLEISALLPLYGTRVRVADGTPGRWEEEILERFGLRWSDFTARRGDRRISRVALEDPEASVDEEGLVVSFALPKGCYATSVLREVMKVDVDEPAEPGVREDDSD